MVITNLALSRRGWVGLHPDTATLDSVLQVPKVEEMKLMNFVPVKKLEDRVKITIKTPYGIFQIMC